MDNTLVPYGRDIVAFYTARYCAHSRTLSTLLLNIATAAAGRQLHRDINATWYELGLYAKYKRDADGRTYTVDDSAEDEWRQETRWLAYEAAGGRALVQL